MRVLRRRIGGITSPISQNAIEDYLRHVQFTPAVNLETISNPFIVHLSNTFNGDPVICRFTTDNPERLKLCFEWFGFDDNKRYYNKINRFIFSLLNNETLKSISDIEGETGFAHLNEHFGNVENFETIDFEEVSPFVFDGELAEYALGGSLYDNWKLDTITTKLMAGNFANQILMGRYDDFRIYRTQKCWNDYFSDFIAYFLFDLKKGELWIFSISDYD
ncbi:hypothetical protein [Rufibacter quisquiliarum]|uniref:Uncharacterized protein n=1 Tax=Rufibacter quisquiliarum TaxID=1549639 RepID=A0A839H1W2_9BACT|nr:hypothetical protein [Rufibacter quisquiliarum]MBA9079871.1 hypothetical protein [Rufibacter quisquiliarum]